MSNMHPPFVWADCTNLITNLTRTQGQGGEPQTLVSSLVLLLACVLGVAVCVAIAVFIIRRGQ
jgi:ABC-type phosphate transport system permease subunit